MKTLSTLSLLATSILMSACSAHVSGDGGAGPAAPNPASALSDFSLEGVWSTRCIASQWGANAGRRIIQVKFTGEAFQYDEQAYSDETCTTKGKMSSFKGIAKVASKLDSGAFVIDYRIPVNEYAYSSRLQLTKIEGESFKASELNVHENEVQAMPLTLEFLKVKNEEVKAVSPVPAPVAKVLQSGDYGPSTNAYCTVNISTEKIGGVIKNVRMFMYSPCSGQTNFTCTDGVCKNSDGMYELTFTSEIEFKILMKRLSRTEIYRLLN